MRQVLFTFLPEPSPHYSLFFFFLTETTGCYLHTPAGNASRTPLLGHLFSCSDSWARAHNQLLLELTQHLHSSEFKGRGGCSFLLPLKHLHTNFYFINSCILLWQESVSVGTKAFFFSHNLVNTGFRVHSFYQEARQIKFLQCEKWWWTGPPELAGHGQSCWYPCLARAKKGTFIICVVPTLSSSLSPP